jgi:hypothetical protein
MDDRISACGFRPLAVGKPGIGLAEALDQYRIVHDLFKSFHKPYCSVSVHNEIRVAQSLGDDPMGNVVSKVHEGIQVPPPTG